MGLCPTKAIEICCCYVVEDQPLFETLEKHLSDLVREGSITLWSKRAIDAGKDWASEIDQRIESAQIILLLLSADFFHSSYSYGREMQEALKQHRAGKGHVIPVLLRPVHYTNPELRKLQTLPANGNAITDWHNQDSAFVDVVKGIHRAIDALPSEPASAFMWKDMDSEGIVARELEVSYPPHIIEQKPTKAKRHPSLKKVSSMKQTDSQLLEPIGEDTHRELRQKAQKLFNRDRPDLALELLGGKSFEQVPSSQRWRLAALRGHCYFGLGMFIHAHEDFESALHDKPVRVPKNQMAEEALLYLHAAETSRGLGRLEEATLYYRTALALMDSQTSIHFAAQAHWGLALTFFEQASEIPYTSENRDTQQLLSDAQSHAEKARTLYQSVEERLHVVSLTCDIAMIEQTSGNREKARTELLRLINIWKPVSYDVAIHSRKQQKQQKEVRNITATAFCYLADIEREDGHYEEAFTLAQGAAEIARGGPLLRQAEAAIMQGKILEQWKGDNAPPPHKTAEEAFREAVGLLASTEMVRARIQAHRSLGRHLLKAGKQRDGEEELDQADFLSLKYAEKQPTTYF